MSQNDYLGRLVAYILLNSLYVTLVSEVIMDPKFHAYYCYLNQGAPVILDEEPENFSQLPYNFTTLCPNFEIARMAYKTNLRIMKWRSSKRPMSKIRNSFDMNAEF